jgi:hypothetical protein
LALAVMLVLMPTTQLLEEIVFLAVFPQLAVARDFLLV